MRKLSIGILLPSIYFSAKRFPNRIFAPRDLALALADGLALRGHRVAIFGSPECPTRATVVAGAEELLYEKLTRQKSSAFSEPQKSTTTLAATKDEFERGITLEAYRWAGKGKLDIIHAWHDSLAHYFDELSDVPTVYTLHDPLPPKGTIEYHRLARFKRHNFVSISKNQRRGGLGLNWVGTVLHGTNSATAPFQENTKNYLAFLGRYARAKGIETAVRVAQKAGCPLIAAGRGANEAGDEYAQTLQTLFKKNGVRNRGMLNGRAKYTFIANAKALLFPIQWDEPFGMVMIEAMATGTPVVAFNRGSVPEVIKNGETGFIVNTEREMVAAVKKIYAMPDKEYRAMRRACQLHVEKNFSLERMVDDYEALYYSIVKKGK